MEATAYARVLAATLPPAELGYAAWRRVRRAALRRVRRFVPAIHDTDVATSLRLTCLEDFAQRMREGRAARGPLEPNERAEARRLIARYFPDHARRCCERADRILAGEPYLFGLWREHARGELAPGIAAFDWTRDPFTGVRAPQLRSRAIDRDKAGTDARAVWEVARFAHVYWLAQAHTVVGLPGTEQARGARVPGVYARAAVLHVRDFLATQPVGRGIHWTCAMEAALRVLHLAPALLVLRDAAELDAFFWWEVATALRRHCRFITEELEDGQTVPGNHLLTDLAALAAVGCLFPELPGALRWRSRALPAFGEELVRQTSVDGLAFEASLPYHRYAAELGLLVQAFARRQGLSLGPVALGRLWRMCELACAVALPDGRLPSIGDNDSTRAFSVEARGALEIAHLAALTAALGGPAVPHSVEPESLWLGGLCGLRKNVARMEVRRDVSRPFAAGGLAVVTGRSGTAATLWAGDNGQHGLGGHAHNDKLACEVVLRGLRFVVDPGCPVYLRDPRERDWYRSTAAHPTVQLDHLEQAPIPDGRPFLLPEAAHARLVRAGMHAAWAEHRGYSRLHPPVLHRREVALPPGHEAVCVTDWVLGDGAHVVDLNWPLSSREVTLRRATRGEREVLDALETSPFGESRFDPERVFALGWPGAEGTRALLSIACEQAWEGEILESTWSPGYGERVCGRTVRVRLRAQCPLVITSVFVWVGGLRAS